MVTINGDAAVPQTVPDTNGPPAAAVTTPATTDPGQKMADESLLSKMLKTKLRELPANADLEVQQRDPNNPLFAAKTFEQLPISEELKKGVRSMGFMKPSKIQETALPILLQNPPENMIAQSQSGTGKTAAFSLTVLSRIDTAKQFPQALILSPTYELALQTASVVKEMGKCITCEGRDLIQIGTKGNRLERGTKITNPIVIGTPGTVMDWVIKFKFFDPKEIKILVFDEADVMIATQGHKDQSVKIRQRLNKDVQTLLFSATYEEKVLKFAKAMVKDPNIITLKKEEESLENIKQFYVRATNSDEKIESLYNVYGVLGGGQAIIFCKTRRDASHVATVMNARGYSVALLTGELEVTKRASTIERFRTGLERVLVCTNVIARGIDVEQVTMVVNFDLPDIQDYSGGSAGPRRADFETYLHRIGRTGRFGKSGIAVNMVATQEDWALLQDIQKHFGRQIEPLDANDLDDMDKKIANEAD